MQIATLYESDVYVLQQIFAPKAVIVVVYDPDEVCGHNFESGFLFVTALPDAIVCDLLICLKETRPDKVKAGIIISLSVLNTGLPYASVYYYLNNTYGTMRWIWQSTLRKPVFFEMNGGEGQYSFFFNWFAWLALRLKKPGWIATGAWHIYSSEPQLSQHAAIDYDQLCIFSGRVMMNHKITLQFIKNNVPAWYAHIFLSRKIEESKRKEYEHLVELNNHKWQHLILPEVRQTGGFTYLSNIFTVQHSPATLKEEHVRAVTEYTSQFLHQETVESYLSHKQIPMRLSGIFTTVHFPAGISLMRLEELFQAMRRAYAAIPLEATIEVSLAHRDFSHWNCRIAGDKLALIDWEKADWNTLRWYDLLYFAFQEAEREEHYNLQSLKQQIAYIQKSIKAGNEIWNVYLAIYSLEYLVMKLPEMLKQHILPYTFNQQLYLWQIWLESLLLE